MRSTISVPFMALLLVACARTEEATRIGADVARQPCTGMADAAIDHDLAELRENVERTTPLHEQGTSKLAPVLRGAEVEVAATRGMTAQWLGRLLWCDAARHPATALVPLGARTDVTPTATGFVIAMRSSIPEVAREIERRAVGFARRVNPSHPSGESSENPLGPPGGPSRSE
jgi:hypothetical protein